MWKPVTKRPKKDDQYLVVYTAKSGKKFYSLFNYKGAWFDQYDTMKITHWRELPRLPK